MGEEGFRALILDFVIQRLKEIEADNCYGDTEYGIFYEKSDNLDKELIMAPFYTNDCLGSGFFTSRNAANREAKALIDTYGEAADRAYDRSSVPMEGESYQFFATAMVDLGVQELIERKILFGVDYNETSADKAKRNRER